MWVEPSKGRRAERGGGGSPARQGWRDPAPMDLLVWACNAGGAGPGGLLVLARWWPGGGPAPPEDAFLLRLCWPAPGPGGPVLWGLASRPVGPASVLMGGGDWRLGGRAGRSPGGSCGGGTLPAPGLLGRAPPSGALLPAVLPPLALIAATLAPSLVERLAAAPPGGSGLAGLYFGLLLALGMLAAQHRLKGLLSSAVLVLGLGLGSLLYYLLGLAPWPGWAGPGPGQAVPGPRIAPLGFQPGTPGALASATWRWWPTSWPPWRPWGR